MEVNTKETFSIISNKGREFFMSNRIFNRNSKNGKHGAYQIDGGYNYEGDFEEGKMVGNNSKIIW